MKFEASERGAVFIGWAIALFILSFHAIASEVYRVPTSPVMAATALLPTEPLGTETRTEQWLKLQAEGRAASATVQSATLQERELSNRRLLDSYSHPIPEFFARDAGGAIEP